MVCLTQWIAAEEPVMDCDQHDEQHDPDRHRSPGHISPQLQSLPAANKGGDMRWFNFGNWKVRFRSGMDFFCRSRGSLEWKIRRPVSSLENVQVLDGCEVAGYVSGAPGHISGVRLHGARGGIDRLDADLVVDATGRGSRTPQWLEQLGFGKPTDTEVVVDVGYASRFYRRPEKARSSHLAD